MNRMVIGMILIFISCKSDRQSQDSDLKGLDSIRYKMAKVYKESKFEKENDIKTYSYSPCLPCDIDFLLRLEQENKISEKDMENLLCIDKGCDNNVEFRQVYNEVLIKIFNEKPDIFSREVYGLTGQNYNQILNELQNPVNDEITVSKADLNSYFLNRIQ